MLIVKINKQVVCIRVNVKKKRALGKIWNAFNVYALRDYNRSV